MAGQRDVIEILDRPWHRRLRATGISRVTIDELLAQARARFERIAVGDVLDAVLGGDLDRRIVVVCDKGYQSS